MALQSMAQDIKASAGQPQASLGLTSIKLKLSRQARL
jgi:hypothetical protein